MLSALMRLVSNCAGKLSERRAVGQGCCQPPVGIYMQTHPSPVPFFLLSCVNMKGLKLLTLPVNTTVPHRSAKRFPEVSPPTQPCEVAPFWGWVSPGGMCHRQPVSLQGSGEPGPPRYRSGLPVKEHTNQSGPPPSASAPPGLPMVLTHHSPSPSPAGTQSHPPCPGMQRSTGSCHVWGSRGTDAGWHGAACETGNILLRASPGGSRSHPAGKHDVCWETSTAETKSSYALPFNSPYSISFSIK